MKFRMKSCDVGNVQHFLNAIQTVSSLTKNFVLRINETDMFFIINERVSMGGSLFWCQINYRKLFTDCAMEGLNTENNEIMLEVVADYLLKSLRQTVNCRSVKIKLIKNRIDCPCLSVDIEQSTDTERTRLVSHEIPVRIVPLRIWDEYLVQPYPEYDVSIHLPALKTLRSVLDKMKNLSSYLVITANNNGELVLEIKNDQVKVRTRFSNLGQPNWKNISGASSTTEGSVDLDRSRHVNTNTSAGTVPLSASVTVDIRKIYQLINSIKFQPQKLVCNIVDQQSLQVFVLSHDMTIQSIVPAIVL